MENTNKMSRGSFISKKGCITRKLNILQKQRDAETSPGKKSFITRKMNDLKAEKTALIVMNS